ncbi:MAG: hypothetical protein K2Q18_09350 [Bdellovibrionales bacterium]|nr:hypothetical protein [Bdellovibrionales bacterium]
MFIKKLSVMCLALFILYINGAIAGDEKGNGADFVVCPKESKLLDFYENNFQDFKWDNTEIELVIQIAQKYYQFSPEIFQTFINHARTFYSETKFVSNTEIGPIWDTGDTNIILPRECKFAQGVLQKLIVFGSEKRYLINKTYWDMLSTVNKAGVIWHEIMYRELMSENSQRIRKFNTWIFFNAFNTIEAKSFYLQFKTTGFPWTYLYNFPMDAQKIIFDNGPVRSMFTYKDKPFNVFSQKVLSKEHMVDSFPNGFPRSMQYTGLVKFENEEYQFEACGQETNCKVNYSKSGQVQLINQVKVINKNSEQVLLNKSIKFNENGDVDAIL